MSDQEPAGLVFDLLPDLGPVRPEGGWSSLREVRPSMWLRMMPSIVRSMFTRGPGEPVGGLPVVEPGQSRPAGLPELADLGEMGAEL